jgi:hypothetical protein
MTGHAEMRKRALVSAHRRSKGDPQARVNLNGIAQDVQLPIEELEIIARQMEELGLVKGEIPDIHNGGWSLVMTMRGIEEAEKMEGPLYQRRPLLFAYLSSVVTGVIFGLVVLFFGRLIGRS